MTLPSSIEIPDYAPRLIDLVVVNHPNYRWMDVYVIQPMTFKGEAHLLALYADELIGRHEGLHVIACRDLDEFLHDCNAVDLSTKLFRPD